MSYIDSTYIDSQDIIDTAFDAVRERWNTDDHDFAALVMTAMGRLEERVDYLQDKKVLLEVQVSELQEVGRACDDVMQEQRDKIAELEDALEEAYCRLTERGDTKLFPYPFTD